MPRTLELTLKRPDKSMKNTKTSAKHSNPKEKRPLFGQRRRAEELPGAQPCHQRGAHPPHSVSVHQRYDRMALPRGDPQKNGNTRIMHKSKRVHFSKLPNVRAFCFIRLPGRGICCAALKIRCYPQRPSGRFLHCPSPQRHDVLRCSAQKRRCLRRRSGQVRLAHLPPQAGGAVRRGKDQVPVKGILAGGCLLYTSPSPRDA